MSWRAEITTPPDECITLGEAKVHLRIDDDIDEDDDLIETLITAARERAQAELKRAIGEQTVTMYLDAWPCGRTIEVAMPPLVSVTSVQYYDEDGDLTTLDDDDYTVSAGYPGRIVLNDDATWPTLEDRPDAVVIEMVCGDQGAGSDIPANIRAAMLLMIGHYYKHREEVVSFTAMPLPFGVQALLGSACWGGYQ